MPENTPNAPKYDKPKILLVDLPYDCTNALAEKGYNVESGTLGRPYNVSAVSKYVISSDMTTRRLAANEDSYCPVISCAPPPNHAEREVLFINLAQKEEPVGKVNAKCPDSAIDMWVASSPGYVDRQPLTAFGLQADFERILRAGGVFVVAAGRLRQQTVALGHLRSSRVTLMASHTPTNWSFLEVLADGCLEIMQDSGNELSPIADPETFCGVRDFLARHADSASFDVYISPKEKTWDHFTPLAQNKYGKCVSALIHFPNHKGKILILPQFENMPEVVTDLVEGVLPVLSPHL